MPPAFPGAVGFGASSVGGRGGTVYKVTNLNDSGVGSFRAACEASGARTVIFETGGTCTLTSNSPGYNPGVPSIEIDDPNISIFGQTAPGQGFTVEGDVIIRTHNLICQHIRFRGNDNFTWDVNDPLSCATVTPDIMHDVIFDSCSASYGRDNVCSAAGVQRITYSNFMIGPQINGGGGNGRGPLIGLPSFTTDISYIRNIIYGCQERNPWIQLGRVEVINNVVARTRDFVGAQVSGWHGVMTANYQGNSMDVFDPDVASGVKMPVRTYGSSEGPAYNATSTIYYDDNYDPVWRPTGAEAQNAMVYNVGTGTFATESGTPRDMSHANRVAPTILSASAARTHALSSIGAGAHLVRDANANFVTYRDSLDSTIRTNMGFSQPRGMNYPASGPITAIAQAGGIPTLTTGLPLGSAFDDTDGDGIPDAYTLPSGVDGADIRPDGYSYLEGYIHGLSRFWDLTGSRARGFIQLPGTLRWI